MPHTFACLLVHVVFSTKDRTPDLSPELAARLFPYMGGIVRECKGTALIINGPADHVHLLLSIPATASIAGILRVLKANSSRWVHEQFPGRKGFAWQAGYGAFTVSNSRLEDVRSYIASQEAHHRKVSFQEEFLTLLKRHGLAYDERDLWGEHSYAPGRGCAKGAFCSTRLTPWAIIYRPSGWELGPSV